MGSLIKVPKTNKNQIKLNLLPHKIKIIIHYILNHKTPAIEYKINKNKASNRSSKINYKNWYARIIIGHISNAWSGLRNRIRKEGSSCRESESKPNVGSSNNATSNKCEEGERNRTENEDKINRDGKMTSEGGMSSGGWISNEGGMKILECWERTRRGTGDNSKWDEEGELSLFEYLV